MYHFVFALYMFFHSRNYIDHSWLFMCNLGNKYMWYWTAPGSDDAHNVHVVSDTDPLIYIVEKACHYGLILLNYPIRSLRCFVVCHMWMNHLLCLILLFISPLIGSKSKVLGPQWDIMSKRMSEQGRPPSAMQDNEVHELDWPLLWPLHFNTNSRSLLNFYCYVLGSV